MYSLYDDCVFLLVAALFFPFTGLFVQKICFFRTLLFEYNNRSTEIYKKNV